jgi:HlyD family secretion protein
MLITAAVVVLALVWGFWPRPVLIETGEVARRPLQVSVEEEGRTRVRDRYVLYAPVAGFLRRIELDVGDPVSSGEALAQLDPLRPAVLDPRARAEAEARVAGARSGLVNAEARARQAQAEAELAGEEFRRREDLLARGLVSRSEYDQARSRTQALEAAARAAESAIEVARYDLEAALATLRYSAAEEAGAPAETVPVRSPIEGRVLKVVQESAGVVHAGQPLLEVGDPRGLEVEVEVLSRDAVRIEPGGRVLFERWGGEEVLEGVVRTVEPTGFTKISALGVEEQRVLVIADIRSPPRGLATARGRLPGRGALHRLGARGRVDGSGQCAVPARRRLGGVRRRGRARAVAHDPARAGQRAADRGGRGAVGGRAGDRPPGRCGRGRRARRAVPQVRGCWGNSGMVSAGYPDQTAGLAVASGFTHA